MLNIILNNTQFFKLYSRNEIIVQIISYTINEINRPSGLEQAGNMSGHFRPDW